jgi:hypothetical protein
LKFKLIQVHVAFFIDEFAYDALIEEFRDMISVWKIVRKGGLSWKSRLLGHRAAMYMCALIYRGNVLRCEATRLLQDVVEGQSGQARVWDSGLAFQ